MARNLILALLAGGLFILYSSVFFVDEREKAILFKFGEIIRSDYEPGLHFKVPFINNVKKFDKRILTIDQKPELFLTGEKKYVLVDSFIKWRIEDVEEFYKATQGGDLRNASLRIYNIIKESLLNEFAKRTIQELVAGDREKVMGIVASGGTVNTKGLGIKIVDVRIKRIDLPPEVSSAVYRRMRTERELVATDLRSKGAEASERIRADADRQRSVTVAEAYRDSEIVRGEGDAIATETYAKAFNRDREFYRFYRSLDAYKAAFSGKNDIILLQPDSDFFKYFKKSGNK